MQHWGSKAPEFKKRTGAHRRPADAVEVALYVGIFLLILAIAVVSTTFAA